MLSITTSSSLATKQSIIQFSKVLHRSNHVHPILLFLVSHRLSLVTTTLSLMAKPKGTTTQPKTSIFLCCFGSFHPKESKTKGSDPIIPKKKKKSSWFSGRSIRIRLINKNSDSKTLPLEASISGHAHYSKSRSKSTLQHNSQAPAANPPLPPQPAPDTPYYTPTQTRHGANNSVEDTRQQGRGSPAEAKRQARRLSSMSKKAKNARSPNDTVVGMSVIAVTLVIMILWGRLCAILCTSVWLYYTPRFRKNTTENNDVVSHATKLNDVDLDSEEYKKKVIMEGLLGRKKP